MFAVKEVELLEDVESVAKSLVPNLTLASPQCVAENKVIRSEVKLGELQQCIRRVQEGPSSLPSVALYTVLNPHQGYVEILQKLFGNSHPFYKPIYLKVHGLIVFTAKSCYKFTS